MLNCETCKDWETMNMLHTAVSGHSTQCPKHHEAHAAALAALLSDLCRGVECWAADEDGVHGDCWPAYRKAKRALGVDIPEDIQDADE